MHFQKRLIPSTSMLMAFDAAARSGSFTKAARELHLTPGAISRQVLALESQLNVMLFKRLGTVIYLTEIGELYSKEIYKTLLNISGASFNAISNRLSSVLNLAISPTFCSCWLLPKYPRFLAEHPDISINFITKTESFDFHNENIHAAIHYGLQNWPNTQNTILMNEDVIPVCSPEFILKNPIDEARELLQLPLLHLSTRANAWEDWFNSHNLKPPKIEGMLFEQFSIITQAAKASLGVALLPEFVIKEELKRGELVALINKPIQSNSSYFLVAPQENIDYQPFCIFRNWLLKTIDK